MSASLTKTVRRPPSPACLHYTVKTQRRAYDWTIGRLTIGGCCCCTHPNPIRTVGPGLENLAEEFGYAHCKDLSGFVACAVASVAAHRGRAVMKEAIHSLCTLDAFPL